MAKVTRITRYITAKKLVLSERTISNKAAKIYAVKPVINILNKYPSSTFSKRLHHCFFSYNEDYRKSRCKETKRNCSS